MIKGYLVAALIFTIGEFLLRVGSSALSPEQRMRLRRLTLITATLLPWIIWFVPIGDIMPTSLASATYEMPLNSFLRDETTISLVGGMQQKSVALQHSAWWPILWWTMLVGWIIGLGPLLSSAIKLRRFLGTARPWNFLNQKNVFVHDTAAMPFSTVVSGRVVVVLPSWMQCNLEHARIALVHELQHIRRLDPCWTLVFSVWSAALWWHPLRPSWRRQLEIDQELICDTLVLQTGVDRKQYWETLFAVAERAIEAHVPEPALGMLGKQQGNNNDFTRRIQAMTQHPKKTRLSIYASLLVMMLTVQISIGCSCLAEGLPGSGNNSGSDKTQITQSVTTMDPQPIQGHLSKISISQIITKQKDHIRYAYEELLQHHPDQQGRVEVRFSINSSGKVINVKLIDDTLKSPMVLDTIVRHLKHLKFPKSAGDNPLEVVYPFIFWAH